MQDLLGSIADAMTNQKGPHGSIKTEADLDRYRKVLEQSAPDLVIECGTFGGGSALWLVEQAPVHVVTIDTTMGVNWEMWRRWDFRVTPLRGSSVDVDVVAEVRRIAEGYERVMVILDSDHSYKHVSRELSVYARLVTPDCYLVVEDTLVKWMPWFPYEGSPYEAAQQFLWAHPEFVADMDIEDLSMKTQCPLGWLRRRP